MLYQNIDRVNTTDKETCRQLIELLVAHGVCDVVLSPGSRNTPLIVAAHRHEKLHTHVVIDERSAAFFGLGIALQTDKPVALICTSGSAILNYGPAIAEAYYRKVPLIAISADRPEEWIDQDDSQTIRQNGVLENIVKGSFNICGDNSDKVHRSFAYRAINDAIILALKGPQGPVHINVRLDEPLSGLAAPKSASVPKIELIGCEERGLSSNMYEILAKRVTGKKVMIIAGFGKGGARLDKALDDFIKKTGAVVLHEAQSNIHPSLSIAHIDATLTTFSDEEITELKPDIVISFGGAILSRIIKNYLRSSTKKIEHWHIAESPNAIDCFLALSKRIECEPTAFFEGLAKACPQPQTPSGSYLKLWRGKAAEAKAKMMTFFQSCPWSDFYAMGQLMKLAPRKWNLHFSNGTAVRYAQLFDYSAFGRIECNRGVSGIDGATSTAIGAHLCYDDVTLLVSGDMSAQYDMGAFALTEITPRFKMAVLNNGGGGIFRFIKSTSALEECEECFVADVRLPLKELAAAYGFAYYEAANKQSFDKAFSMFAAEKTKPAILNIITPPQESAEILRNFFHRAKKTE